MTFFIAIVPLYGSNIIFDWFGFIFTKFAFSSCQLSKEFKVDNKIENIDRPIFNIEQIIDA